MASSHNYGLTAQLFFNELINEGYSRGFCLGHKSEQIVVLVLDKK